MSARNILVFQKLRDCAWRLVDDFPVDRTARAAIGLDVVNRADPLLTGRVGDRHHRTLWQREFALQNHDAVMDATTKFHSCILSRSAMQIKSTLRFARNNR